MNIFYLDPDPIISAHMHCDQHLHKMILESAQMLSTILRQGIPDCLISYKPSYESHPCALWLKESKANIHWLLKMVYQLEHIRTIDLNRPRHASMDVIEFCDAYLSDVPTIKEHVKQAIFCGPAFIKLNNAAYPTVQSKYRAYYLHKAKQWALDGKPRMSYRGRSVPDFLKGCEYVSQ